MIEELAATVTYAPTKRQKIFRPDRTLDRGTAPSISGWSGASFTGKTGTTSELAYLYTDIGAPAKRVFWKVYGKDETGVIDVGTVDLTGEAESSTAGYKPIGFRPSRRSSSQPEPQWHL